MAQIPPPPPVTVSNDEGSLYYETCLVLKNKLYHHNYYFNRLQCQFIKVFTMFFFYFKTKLSDILKSFVDCNINVVLKNDQMFQMLVLHWRIHDSILWGRTDVQNIFKIIFPHNICATAFKTFQLFRSWFTSNELDNWPWVVTF